MAQSPTYIDIPIGNGVVAQYPVVQTYAELPDYTTVQGQIYVVATTTGILPRRSAGFYLATPTGWTYLGDLSPAYIKQLYESNADTNAFNDYYKAKLDGIVSGAITANAVIVDFDADSSVQPGDIVISSGVDNTVTSLNGNSYSGLAFGFCYDKPTAITARIQVAGVLPGFTGFHIGGPIFIGTDGKPTTTPPPTGDIQIIGIAVKSTSVSINFAPSKVTRP